MRTPPEGGGEGRVKSDLDGRLCAPGHDVVDLWLLWQCVGSWERWVHRCGALVCEIGWRLEGSAKRAQVLRRTTARGVAERLLYGRHGAPEGGEMQFCASRARDVDVFTFDEGSLRFD